MLAIHPVHRRLAEITAKARRLGGYARLSWAEQVEIIQILEINANLVQKLDGLKNLAFMAHCSGDFAWEQEICCQIDELEAKML